jgi:hypothetical protein
MNTKHVVQIAILAMALISMGAWAANEPSERGPNKQVDPAVRAPNEQGSNKQTDPAVRPPVYKPPVGRGLPGGRVGGGTRGDDLSFVLSVLAPNHTGLTLQEQPALYWFVSKRIVGPLEFTLTDDGVKPVIESRLDPPIEAGIHELRLADYGVKLTPGKRYSWYVTRVMDPERRSRDILAGGTMERVESVMGLTTTTVPANLSQAPFLYAEAGLWYDAIEAISKLIDASPADLALRQQRAALLEQAGLTEVARYDITLTRVK